MIVALWLLAGLAALALAGWILAELELRDTERALDDAEHDLAVAQAWMETQVVRGAVVHPTLHAIKGGEDS